MGRVLHSNVDFSGWLQSHLCVVTFLFQKNKNKKKGKDEKCGSEVTTPENSSSPGMMDMHGEWEKVRPNSPLALLSKCKPATSDSPLL